MVWLGNDVHFGCILLLRTSSVGCLDVDLVCVQIGAIRVQIDI